MYRKIFAAVTTISLIALLLPLASFAKDTNQDNASHRVIVVFKDGTTALEKTDTLARAGAHELKALSSGGRVAEISDTQAKNLENNPHILRVEQDAIASITRRPSPPPPSPSQQTPWGIAQILAPQSWSVGQGAGVKVAVVDTGIDLAHPDLAASIVGGYNAIYSFKSADDDNGHGTHVAGIIGAINNAIGVVGVAPKVSLMPVKVLGANGSGYYSDIIEGIDWAVANGAKVINMSLGGTSDVQSLHDAVIRAHDAGVSVVAAAGNSGGAVIYPAAYPEVIAVGATDSSNTIASWSSRGPEVDVTAPGVNIYSTYKGETYATLSGTSMASPHVAGLAAVLSGLVTPCDTDHNGSCSPDEIQSRIETTATDLGPAGYDTTYGSGLINMYAATR